MSEITTDTTVTATDAIPVALRRLADARRRVDRVETALTPLRLQLEDELDRLTKDWEARHKALLDEQIAAEEAVAQAETDVRAMAELHFAETGEKKPAPGVQVKEFAVVAFDPTEGFDYALKYNLSLLRLDRKSYERALKEWNAEDGVPPMPGTVTKEGRAYIDSNLDAYYPPEPEQESVS